MACDVAAHFCRWPLRSLLVLAAAVASSAEGPSSPAHDSPVRVLLRLETAEASSSSAAADALAAFEVDGSWTGDEALASEAEASAGPVFEKDAVLQSWPTRVRLRVARSPEQAASWGLARAELLHVPSGRSLALLGPCKGDECEVQQGSARRVDGSGAHSVFRVPPLRCAEADGPGCRGAVAAAAPEVASRLRRASSETAGANATSCILVSLTVRNVDFSAIEADAALRSDFETAVAGVLAAEASVGRAPGDLHLTPSRESVQVQASVDLPADLRASSVLFRLQTSTSLETSLASAVRQLHGIAAAARGSISVGSLEMREMTAVRGAPVVGHQEPSAPSTSCADFSCPSGTEALTSTCRTGNCTAAECCRSRPAAPSPSLAAQAPGLTAPSSCDLPLGEVGWGVPCWGVDAGTGFVLYSKQALRSRFGQHLPAAGAAERLVCVRFRQGTWQYSSSSAWHPFSALPTDVLVAEVSFSLGTALNLLGVQDFYEGISKGYALGNVEFRPEGWITSPGGSGRFAVSGQYISLDSCRGPQLHRNPGSVAQSCEIVVGISCHLQRPMIILGGIIVASCFLCCLYKLCQVRLGKQKKAEFPSSATRPTGKQPQADRVAPKQGTGGAEGDIALDIFGIVASADKNVCEEEAWTTMELRVHEKQKRVQESVQDEIYRAPMTDCTFPGMEAYLGASSTKPCAAAASREVASREVDCGPPLALQVVSPNEQRACTGEYRLIPDETANGMPVWKKLQGNRWLYPGMDGKWYVGGSVSRRFNFQSAAGFLCSSQPHGGRMPDRIIGAWEVGNGTEWHQDRDVVVTALVAGASSRAFEASEPLAEEDSPGMYVITHKEAAVTGEVHLAPPIIAHLSAGMSVRVLEVARCPRERRIRGRIDHPAGWISLLSLEDGYRWAQRVQVCAEEKVENVDVYAIQKKKAFCMDAPPADPALVNLAVVGKEGKETQELSEFSTDQGSSSGLADDKSPSGNDPPSSVGDGSSSLGTPPESVCDQPVAPSLQSPSASDASEAVAPPPRLSTSEASEAASSESPPGLPQVLCVESPNGQFVCTGEYELVPKMMPNSMPLWKQRNGEHWMYSGKARRWCIGGQDIIGRGFDTNAGWIFQGCDHNGLPPDQSPGQWIRWNGGTFEVDPAIAVTAPKQQKDLEVDLAVKWRAEANAPIHPEEQGRGAALDVVLECIHAGGMETKVLDLHHRCFTHSLEAGDPWAVGPLRQPEVFHGLMRKGCTGFVEDLLELCWRPPCLYLQRSSRDSLLLVNGQVLQSPTALLQHGFEVSACARGAKQELPVFTFRIVSDPSEVRSLQTALQAEAAQSTGRSILDLRGSRLSTEERRAMCGCKEEALRVVI